MELHILTAAAQPHAVGKPYMKGWFHAPKALSFETPPSSSHRNIFEVQKTVFPPPKPIEKLSNHFLILTPKLSP